MSFDQTARKGVAMNVVTADKLHKIKANGDLMAYLSKGERLGDKRVGILGRAVKKLTGAKITCWSQLPDAFKNFVADQDCLVVVDTNAYVNTGLQNSLDREFNIGGSPVAFIGVSNSQSPVTETTIYLNGATPGTAANTIIKPISPAPVRSNQTTTAGATFTNADFTDGVFIWYKLGFLTTASDAGTGLVDVIGGVGGVAPYNKTFALDLTGAGEFTVVAQIAVTALAA